MLSLVLYALLLQPSGLDGAAAHELLERAAAAMGSNDFREAERLSRRVWAAADPQAQPSLHFQAANALGAALSMLGRDEEAERLFREASSADPGVFVDQQADAMRAMSNLAQVLAARGDLARAEPLLKRSLWWFVRNTPLDSRQLALEHHNLGSIYLQAWRHAEAREHLDAAAQLWIRAGSRADSVDRLQTDVALGLLASQTGNAGEAFSRLQRARLEVRELHLPEMHPLIHSVLLATAMVEMQRGRVAHARELLEQSLKKQWLATDQLPNGLLMRSIALYRKILERAKDRESLRRVSRWTASLEHGHLKSGFRDCAE